MVGRWNFREKAVRSLLPLVSNVHASVWKRWKAGVADGDS